MWFLVTVDMLKCMHVDDQPAQNVAIYLQAVPDNAVLVVKQFAPVSNRTRAICPAGLVTEALWQQQASR